MVEYVVGNADESVFLAIHLAVLLYEGQAVNVGVNHYSKVVAAIGHFRHYATEVFLQWLRVVGEVAVRSAVKELILNA